MATRTYSQHLLLLLFLLIGSLLLFYAEYVVAATAAAAPSAAVEAAGQVVWVKGVVKALAANNTPRTLARRGVVYAQDTITTDSGSSGEIVFSDNTLLSINPGSEIKIAQYKFTHGAAPAQDKYLVSVAKGGFRTITGAIAKSNPANYQVNTPVATIGVRGTEWAIVINGQKMFLKIEKGSIQIVTPKGKAILDKDTDKLYATIDFFNPIPQILSVAPQGAFANEPPMVPASSTLTTNTNTGTGGGFTGGGFGGPGSSSGGPGTPSGPGGSSTGGGSGAPVSGFCIQ